MKRPETLLRLVIGIVVIIGVIAITVPQPILDESEWLYLVLIVIPLGALWIRAYIDASRDN